MSSGRNYSDLLVKPIRENRVLFLAPLVGFLGALVTHAFRLCLSGVQHMLVGHSGSFVEMAQSLSWYWRLSLPCLGGVFAGSLLLVARRFSTGRPSDYMESVALGDGRIPVKHTLLRSVSSLSTIASGGSIGREGAMVQLAAMSASILGGRLALATERLRLLVACGAAAGISAAYNAPIAGAFFVAEIVLGAVVMDSFGPVIVASVAANLTMRALPGYQPVYRMPAFPDIPGDEIGLLLVLGLLAGLLMPRFLRLIGQVRSGFAKLALPLPAQLGVGGLMVGVLSLRVPQVWGNGYSVVNSMLHTDWVWSVVLLVLACKILATAFTVGSGAVGGVFTPTLFIGATTGNLFAQAVHAMWPHLAAAPYAYSMVGMGAFLSAATGAPLMAIFMIFEMTLSYQIMLPLTLASVVAYFVVKSRDALSMYEITARRRQHERALMLLRATRMADLIQPAVTVLPMTASLADASAMFLQHPVKYIYVVDEANRYEGVLSHRDMTAALLSRTDAKDLLVGGFVRDDVLALVTPDMSLDEALQRFLAHQGERLPIVQEVDNPVLLGAIHKTALLDAYSRLNEVNLSRFRL